MKLLGVAMLATASQVVIAAPHVVYDGLFRKHATWRLPCTLRSDDDKNVLPTNAAIECAIDAVSDTNGVKRAHLECTGPGEILADLHRAYGSRTFVATRAALWSVDDDPDAPPIEVAKLVHQPPLLPAHPTATTREVKHDAEGNGGIRYTTLAHAGNWCVATRPWGTGGAERTWLMCFSPAGAITGVAAFKREMTSWTLSCGSAPDPES